MINFAPQAPYLLVLNATEGAIQYLVAKLEEPSCQGGLGVVAKLKQNDSPEFELGQNNLPEAHLLPEARILAAHFWHVPSQGAELLAPALANTFASLHIGFQELGHIACVLGPGSFTGLRLALATSAGLARTTPALQGGLAYLPLLAEGAFRAFNPWHKTTPASFWAITHARRDLVHAQKFTTQDGKLGHEGQSLELAEQSRTTEQRSLATELPCLATDGEVLVLSVGELVKELAQSVAPCVCFGSGVCKNLEALNNASWQTKPHFLPPEFNHPHFEDLLQGALLADYTKEDLNPLYARPCEAEENITHIAGLLHLDPEQAKAELSKITSRRELDK